MEMSSASTGVVSERPQSGFSLRGLLNVIFSPSSFFQTLKDNPRIVVPWIAIAVLYLVSFLLIADLLWELQKNSPQMQAQLQGHEVSPQVERFAKYSIILGGTLVMVLAPLLLAAVAMFFGNFVFGGQAPFKKVLSVALYSEYVFGLAFFATALLMLVKGSALASLSLATLVADSGPMSFAYNALSKIGVCYIWEVIVFGIGLAAAYGFARNKGYLVSVISVGSLAVLQIISTAIQSAMS